MSDVFRHRIRVRYGECDLQGVVFNANWLAYFDVVITELWRDRVGDYMDMIERGVDMVVAEAGVRFRAPARFDDVVDPDRLGVLGGSYGGYMTSWMIGHTDRFKAAVSERAVNNMLVLCNSAVAAEGMMMAKMAGVDLDRIVEVITNGSGFSNSFRGVTGRAMKGKFEPSFALDLAYKDLSLAIDLATEHGVPGMVAPQVLKACRGMSARLDRMGRAGHARGAARGG